MLNVCLVLSVVILGHVLQEAIAYPRIDAADGEPENKAPCSGQRSGRSGKLDPGHTKHPPGLCHGSGYRRQSRRDFDQQLSRSLFPPRMRRSVSQQLKPVGPKQAENKNVTSKMGGSVGQTPKQRQMWPGIQEPVFQQQLQNQLEMGSFFDQQQPLEQSWPVMESFFDQQQPMQQLWPGMGELIDQKQPQQQQQSWSGVGQPNIFQQQSQGQLWPVIGGFSDQQQPMQQLWPGIGEPIDKKQPQQQQQSWSGVGKPDYQRQQSQDQLWPGMGGFSDQQQKQFWPETGGVPNYHSSQGMQQTVMNGPVNIIQQERFQSYGPNGMTQKQSTRTTTKNNKENNSKKKIR